MLGFNGDPFDIELSRDEYVKLKSTLTEIRGLVPPESAAVLDAGLRGDLTHLAALIEEGRISGPSSKKSGR
jgi:hypothetical protein